MWQYENDFYGACYIAAMERLCLAISSCSVILIITSDHALTDLVLQHSFNCTAWNHHGFIFNNNIQLILGKRVAATNHSKDINAEISTFGITIKASALFFNGMLCLAVHLLSRA